MRARYRRALGLGVAGAIIALPPPGDEIIGLELGALIGGYKMNKEDTTTGQRERRAPGTSDDRVPKYVAGIVIVSIVILAAQVGLLRGFVQH